MFPSVTVNFDPGGANASADVSAMQYAYDPDPQFGWDEYGTVALSVSLYGNSLGSFSLDAVAGAMGLGASSGVSGSIMLSEAGYFCGYCFPYFPIRSNSVLLDFEFQNGIVTVSSNSLGLTLPGVGSPADFALSSLSPFAYTFPAIGAYGPFSSPVFYGFNGFITNTVSQDASLAAPEPGAFPLAFFGLGILLLTATRRRLSKSSRG